MTGAVTLAQTTQGGLCSLELGACGSLTSMAKLGIMIGFISSLSLDILSTPSRAPSAGNTGVCRDLLA